MKIRFTSIAWEGVSELFSKITVPLEEYFNAYFSDVSYGAEIIQFTVVAIAVDSDMDSNQNKKFFNRHNKSGTYKHPLTGERVKFLSFAIEYRHEDLEGKDECELCKIFCTDLYRLMDAPVIKIPKGFDYPKFASDMKNALEKYL